MRLAVWAASLAVGIALAISVVPTAVAVLAAVGIAAAVPLACLRAWSGFAAVATLVCGLGLGYHEVAILAAPAPVAEDKLVEVAGEIVQGADVELPAPEDETANAGGRQTSPGRCHVRIRARRVDGRPVDATLSLLVLGGVPDLAPGDWVQFSARLYLPRGFANPGVLDARLLARGQGIDLVAAVRSPGDLRRIDGRMNALSRCRRWAAVLRRAMARVISSHLREPAAGFVRTMVLGERSEVPERTEDGFRAAGATHVLSVSGLHLAVVVALFFRGVKWLLARRPSWSLHVPARSAASLLSLPACFFYTLLTGEAVATVRSAIMAAMVLGAAIVNRPVSLPAAIAAAAVILLVQSPSALLDVSFQLSFASVIGLGLFARWLIPTVQRRHSSRWQRMRAWLLGSFSASFAASLITTPLVAHHFGEITPAAPLGNLVLVPVVELVVLPCGLVGSLLALVHSWLGALPLLVAGLGSRLALFLAEVFRRLAPVALVRYPDWCETLLLVGTTCCWLQAAAARAHRRRRWFVVGAVAGLLAAGSLVGREIGRRTERDLRVTFLDVGQGDSALVEGPGGFAALIDGGGRYDNSFDTGARIVEPVLRARGITRLDLVVLSHPHPDHMNGLFRILRRFPVGALWQNGDDGGNLAFHDLVRLAREQGVALPTPGVVERNGMTIEAVGPWFEGRIGAPPGLGANDASLVVRVRYAGRQILFTGDIGDEGEAWLLERRRKGITLHSDVVKVPHHGSRHASSDDLIDALAPSLAAVSAGRYNRFGLPSSAALDRYRRRGIEVRRTDRDGAITVGVNPAGDLRVACMRDCSLPWRADEDPPSSQAQAGLLSSRRTASVARPQPLR
jgi:competence protein ComEC